MKRQRKLVWRRRVDAVLTVVMLGVAALSVWSFVRRPPPPKGEPALPKGPLMVEGLLARGSEESTAAVIVFSDFQCPFCARFASKGMRALVKDVADTGLALVQFAHFPLDDVHPIARAAAQAVECARHGHDVGWQLHDKLFEINSSGNLRTRQDLDAAIAVVAGPGFHDAVKGCVDSGREDQKITSQIDLGKVLGVKGTPTLVVGRRKGSSFFPTQRIVGAPPTAAVIIEQLRRIPKNR